MQLSTGDVDLCGMTSKGRPYKNGDDGLFALEPCAMAELLGAEKNEIEIIRDKCTCKTSLYYRVWAALRKLEARGRIKILASHHQRFGNIYNDTHSYVVWRPGAK